MTYSILHKKWLTINVYKEINVQNYCATLAAKNHRIIEKS